MELTKEMAEQGDSSAQLNLGVLYSSEQGVTQDNVMAHMYFNIVAVSGAKDAVENRDIENPKCINSNNQ